MHYTHVTSMLRACSYEAVAICGSLRARIALEKLVLEKGSTVVLVLYYYLVCKHYH